MNAPPDHATAAVLHANGELRVEAIPLARPSATECTLRVGASSVCSSDVPRAFEGGAYHYPLVMGHEFAGEVVAVGGAVTGFQPGDRATVFPLIPCRACEPCKRGDYAQCEQYDYYGSRRDGGFAEYLNVEAWNLLPLPPTISTEQGALVEPCAVAVHALRRADLLEAGGGGGEVAVLGAGFIGLVAARVLRLRRPELRVTLVDRNPQKLALGASAVAETQCLDGDGRWQAFIAREGARFDVVIEATGAPAAFAYSTQLARRGGTVIWVGNITGDMQLGKDNVSAILRKELRILGSWNSRYAGREPSDWTEVLALIESGLAPETLVSQRVTLDGLPGTLRELHARKRGTARHGAVKVLVTPGASPGGEGLGG